MKTITVKGVGKVSEKPDYIEISLKLNSVDKDYGKTIEHISEKIDKLNKSLEEIGFEKGSLKTTNFNVKTRYDSVKTKTGDYESVFKGYECRHSLKLSFDFDTKRLAKVLSAMTACVANPEFSISFTVKDQTKISKELLISASKNAKEKAEILCEASGTKLGELISIDYNWGDLNTYSNTDYSLSRMCNANVMADYASIDIEPEDMKIDDTATFVWEIK